MSTQELKKKLITRIQEEGNNDLLERVLNMFDKADSESIYLLNGKQIEAITEATKQFETGEFLSHEESKAATDKWLNT